MYVHGSVCMPLVSIISKNPSSSSNTERRVCAVTTWLRLSIATKDEGTMWLSPRRK